MHVSLSRGRSDSWWIWPQPVEAWVHCSVAQIHTSQELSIATLFQKILLLIIYPQTQVVAIAYFPNWTKITSTDITDTTEESQTEILKKPRKSNVSKLFTLKQYEFYLSGGTLCLFARGFKLVKVYYDDHSFADISEDCSDGS